MGLAQIQIGNLKSQLKESEREIASLQNNLNAVKEQVMVSLHFKAGAAYKMNPRIPLFKNPNVKAKQQQGSIDKKRKQYES